MRDAKVISGILCYCELLYQKLEIEHENCCALMLKNIEIAATIFPLFKTERILKIIPKYFEKDGEQYSKIRRVFGRSLRHYYSASRNIAKYIGGMYHSRHHVGDAGGENPFKIVPAKKQREALTFILDNILKDLSLFID